MDFIEVDSIDDIRTSKYFPNVTYLLDMIRGYSPPRLSGYFKVGSEYYHNAQRLIALNYCNTAPAELQYANPSLRWVQFTFLNTIFKDGAKIDEPAKVITTMGLEPFDVVMLQSFAEDNHLLIGSTNNG